MNIYENILAEAKKQGKSILQIEQASNLSNGTISKWNNSKPRIDRIQKVAKFLGVPLEKLIK